MTSSARSSGSQRRPITTTTLDCQITDFHSESWDARGGGVAGFHQVGGNSGSHGRCWPLQEKKWRRAVSKCSTILLKETQKTKGTIKKAKDAHRSVRKTFSRFRSKIKRMARSQGSVTLEQIEHLLAM